MSAASRVRRVAFVTAAGGLVASSLFVSPIAQALPPGWADPTYAGAFPVGLDAPPLAVAVDSSGRALAVWESSPSAKVGRLGVDGGVDATFGTSGTTDLSAGPQYSAILVGSDGIYVAGTPATGNGIRIVRLTPDGVPDPTYGSGGVASVAVPAALDEVVDLTQLDSGDLVVAAARAMTSPHAYYLAAVTTSGTLDAGWNAAGTTPGVRAVVDPLVGVTHAGNATAAATTTTTGVTRVRQFTAVGAPDAAFGSAGVLTLPASFAGAGIDVGADTKYYLAGSTGTDPNQSLSVARILPSTGKLDSAFGASGLSSMNVGNQRGQSTVTAGAFVYAFGTGPTIVRMSSTGAVDPTFGSGGFVSGFPPCGANKFRNGGPVGGGVQPSGKAVVLFSSVDDDAFVIPCASRVRAATNAPAGAFVSLLPTRVLDTRTGNGAPKGAVAPGGSVTLQVGGRGGVPDPGVGVGVAAVTMTVTAVAPTRSGFVTVYPSGTARPSTSTLNHPGLATTANLVMVPVGADGKVVLYNGSAGTVHLLADVLGYHLGGVASAPGAFASVPPTRVLDTRNGTGAPHAMVPAGGTLTLTVAGAGGVPASGAAAVVLNTTVVGQTKTGYLTIYPNGSARPNVSNLNFYPGQPRANLAIVRLGSDGALSLFNASTAPVDLAADVAGYYLDGTPTKPGTFVSVDPTRILDTRTFSNPHGIPSHATLIVASQLLPFQGNAAYVMNATVTRISQPGFATFRGGDSRGPFPTSTVTFAAGQTTASLTVTAGSGFVVYNGSRATIHAIADLAGYVLP